MRSLWVLLVLCGCSSELTEDAVVRVATTHQAVRGRNGLSSNGLSSNGLSSNGLSSNGLSSNGLATSAFSTWFNLDADRAETTMGYVVKCALPADTSLAWTNPATGELFTWAGELGLTPGWASGRPATELEQQLITACLAAHVNKFGRRVTISVLGRAATGVPLAVGSTELASFAVKEACFFGNVFTGEGVFVGDDHTNLDDRETSIRACALGNGNNKTDSECPPLRHVGDCAKLCTEAKDTGKTWFETCSPKGSKKPFAAITTRIASTDVYFCGDGVCQPTESCGTSDNTKKWDNCGIDCGRCE